MAIDQPIIVHPRDKSKPPSKRKMRELAERWNEERKTRESYVGRKIDINEILNPKQQQSDGR